MDILLPIQLIALICIGVLFVYTVYLIRINKLSAHLAVSWVMTELFFGVLLCIKQLPIFLMQVLGKNNIYSVAFIFVVGWIILLMLDTLTRVSELTNKNRAVIEENGLLRERVERLEEIIRKSSQRRKNTDRFTDQMIR